MGCFSFKSKVIVLTEVPNFQSNRNEKRIEDEIKFIDEFFDNVSSNFVPLKLESNDLRQKRFQTRMLENEKSMNK